MTQYNLITKQLKGVTFTLKASLISVASRTSRQTKFRPMAPGTTSSGAGGTELTVKACSTEEQVGEYLAASIEANNLL